VAERIHVPFDGVEVQTQTSSLKPLYEVTASSTSGDDVICPLGRDFTLLARLRERLIPQQKARGAAAPAIDGICFDDSQELIEKG
jgi:hypothetical protein